jgi:hypothetical protein
MMSPNTAVNRTAPGCGAFACVIRRAPVTTNLKAHR